jgi:hypothetical protein
MTPDIVEATFLQAGGNRVKTFVELPDSIQNRVSEIIDEPLEDNRAIRPFTALDRGFHIDGDAPGLAVGHYQDLVMRRCVIVAFLGRSDDPATQCPVS